MAVVTVVSVGPAPLRSLTLTVAGTYVASSVVMREKSTDTCW